MCGCTSDPVRVCAGGKSCRVSAAKEKTRENDVTRRGREMYESRGRTKIAYTFPRRICICELYNSFGNSCKYKHVRSMIICSNIRPKKEKKKKGEKNGAPSKFLDKSVSGEVIAACDPDKILHAENITSGSSGCSACATILRQLLHNA